jgi:anthranilate synthase component I
MSKVLTKTHYLNVCREIAADLLTPIGVINSLVEELKDGAVLESAEPEDKRNIQSFIGLRPIAQLRVQDKIVHQRIGSKTEILSSPPLQALRNLIAQFSSIETDGHQPTRHCTIGFLSYDAVRLFENIPDRHAGNNLLPDMFFNFYQTILIFDHSRKKLFISTLVSASDSTEKAVAEAEAEIDAILNKISNAKISIKTNKPKITKQYVPEVDLNDQQYCEKAATAKAYIAAGDAFQIVLSRQFKRAISVEPLEIYRALHQVSPAPYMFYLNFENITVVGASPEKLISIQNGEATIHPIAGTRRKDSQRSAAEIAEELLNDKKERAEHMMLVDLARNDLGAVCEPGSVRVKELMDVRHFSHVSHITSTITGKLRNHLDALDALASAFPAGTLSGAPKIRAMEIIDELETSRRGLYGGAICRLDFQGNLDSCIGIRMAVLKDGVATVRTGAGIVHDSNPQSEAEETRQKAAGILAAIHLAELEDSNS